MCAVLSSTIKTPDGPPDVAQPVPGVRAARAPPLSHVAAAILALRGPASGSACVRVSLPHDTR